MSRFIPKEVLTEGMAANPLDKGVAEEQDITTLAQEGILTAAAAETDAINQYMQILDMVDRSESWLSNLVKPTLEDIISEEKKHFAQLSTIVSKLPAFKKEFEAGKEEAETGKDKEDVKEAKSDNVYINHYKPNNNKTLQTKNVNRCASSSEVKAAFNRILPKIKSQLDYLKDK